MGSVVRFLSPLLGFALVASSIAQLQGPTGEFDANPQNPANWEVVPSVLNGSETATRKEQVNGSIFTAVYTRNWTGSWLRNGQPTGAIPVPFGQVVSEDDEISWHSSGSVKVGLTWKSPYPAPATVRCKVAASAKWLAKNFPAGNCNDGFESSSAVNPGDYTMQGSQLNSFRFLTLNVNSGVVEYTLNQVASATDHGPVVTASPMAAVLVATGTATIAVDNRMAFISAVGGGAASTRRRIEGVTLLNRPYYTWVVPSGNNAPYPQLHEFPFIRPAAVPETCEVTWTPVGNSSTIHTSLGHRTQSYHNSGGMVGYHTPEVVDDLPATLLGSTSGDHFGTESYKWGAENEFGSSVTLSGPYDISEMTTYHDPLLYQKRTYAFMPSHNSTKWFEADNSALVRSLEYTWSDGLAYTSQRTIIRHDPTEEITYPSQMIYGWKTSFTGLEFDDYDEWAPKEVLLTHVKVPSYYWTTQVVETAAITLAGLADSVPGTEALAIGRWAFLCAALQHTFLAGEPDLDIYQIGKSIDGNIKEYWRGWVNGQPGERRFNSPFPGTFIQEYKWKAEHCQRVAITPTTADYYSLSGFTHRLNAEKKDEQKPMDALRRMIYMLDSSGNGGTGGTNPD